MTYTDFNLVGIKRATNVVCQLRKADGTTREKRLDELVPVVTDYGVSFAMSLEFTLPAFAILFAIARVWWYRRSTRIIA